MAKVFSLNSSRAVAEREERGTTIALRDETGDPLTVSVGDTEVQATITIVGKLSGTYRRIEQQLNDRLLKRRTTELTSEVIERNELEKIAACVKDWNLTDEGKPLPCTKENVLAVLTAAPWIRRELDQVMSDPSRFLD